MTTPRYRGGWQIMGGIFGFPPCCIAEFESRDISPYYWNWLHDPFFRPSGMPPYWWDGTGFIPARHALAYRKRRCSNTLQLTVWLHTRSPMMTSALNLNGFAR